MTSIGSTSNNSTALLLLQQTRVSLVSGNGDGNATGTNLDTTSGDRDAVMATIKRLATAWQARRAAQANAAPRQADAAGTVSVAASTAWKSGMASVGAAEIGASGNTAEIGAGGTSIARTVDNAEAVVGVLARAVNDYNGKFELQEIPTREEYMASRDNWISKVTAMGSSEELIKRGVESNFGEGGYERALQTFEVRNQGLLRYSELAVDAISGSTDHLKGAFGVKVQISYDEEGHASVAPFDIYYRNGQKMLSYGEDGFLTSYNEDGTVKLALNNKEAAKIPMGYYRS